MKKLLMTLLFLSALLGAEDKKPVVWVEKSTGDAVSDFRLKAQEASREAYGLLVELNRSEFGPAFETESKVCGQKTLAGYALSGGGVAVGTGISVLASCNICRVVGLVLAGASGYEFSQIPETQKKCLRAAAQRVADDQKNPSFLARFDQASKLADKAEEFRALAGKGEHAKR